MGWPSTRLEAEMRMWAVPWDVVSLAEMWLDMESEKRVGLEGYVVECASLEDKGRGGVALFIKEGLMYKTRPDLGIFEEGEFESVFIEIDRGGGHRNDVVGVVYRPPRTALSVFIGRMAQLLGRLWRGGVNGSSWGILMLT
jgi:exonuclease III